MITDLFMSALFAPINWLLGLLPEHELDLPPVDGVATFLARLDSVVPIGPVITMAMVVLSMAAVFVIIRAVLVVRHVVLP